MNNLTIKVTKINKNYHARLWEGSKLINEWACSNKEDIWYICRQLLRWYDKMGGNSKYAYKARHRNKGHKPLVGKVYGPAQLPIRKH
jgi:hypothetical protein